MNIGRGFVGTIAAPGTANEMNTVDEMFAQIMKLKTDAFVTMIKTRAADKGFNLDGKDRAFINPNTYQAKVKEGYQLSDHSFLQQHRLVPDGDVFFVKGDHLNEIIGAAGNDRSCGFGH